MLAKKNLLIIALMMLPFLSSAQLPGERNFKLGFTTSPTFGWLNFQSGRIPTINSDGLRAGFSYGILGDFGFSDNYFFSSAFTVTTINAKTKTTAFNSGPQPDVNSSIYKLQYLEIPLTIKLKSSEKKGKRFYGQFGLTTGINIGAKKDSKSVFANGSTTEEKNKDIADMVNSFRLGLIFGGGAEWKVGQNLNVLTGISYNNGFTSVLNNIDKTKNSYLSLNLGIFF